MFKRSLLVPLFLALSVAQCLAELPSDSIYRLKGDWVATTGERRRLNTLVGKPTLIATIYTHCRGVCPAIVDTMKLIERRYGPKLNYALVTLDPGRDDTKALSEFSTLHDLKSPPWLLLAGSVEQTRELSVALQLKQSATETGEFVHTNAILALDKEGIILGSQVGGKDPQPMIELLRPLVTEQAR